MSIYNLSTIYLYENPPNKNNIDKTIELLIHSSRDKSIRILKRKTFLLIELLCYVLILRYKFDVINIIDHLRNDYNVNSEYFLRYIANFILEEKLNIQKVYYKKFEKYRNVDYVYDLDCKIVCYDKLMKSHYEVIKSSKLQKNLSKDFYDGFGIDLK